MKLMPYLRFATYAMIVAIAFMLGKPSRVIPVGFAQQEDAPGPSPAVVELESWCGKDAPWIKKQLGDAEWEHVIKLPVPNIGVFQGVQSKLEKSYPGYSGEAENGVRKQKTGSGLGVWG